LCLIKLLPIRQFLLTNLIRPPNSKSLRFRVPISILAGALDNMGDFPIRDPDEARFEKPTLFIRGTESRYVTDDVLPLIGRFFPRFELRDIASGHWVISEKPEEFRSGKLALPRRSPILTGMPVSCGRILAEQKLKDGACGRVSCTYRLVKNTIEYYPYQETYHCDLYPRP